MISVVGYTAQQLKVRNTYANILHVFDQSDVKAEIFELVWTDKTISDTSRTCQARISTTRRHCFQMVYNSYWLCKSSTG